MAGRFAPTPTSDLHVGNLRTALAAWLAARADGREFRLRVEDLDRDRIAAAAGTAERQLADLAALGLTHDGPVVWQSDRTPAYEAALAALGGRVYECFCSRQEIALAAQAPHAADGLRPYPGTCRDLTEAERARRRRHRSPALRVRANGAEVTLDDRLAGRVTGVVDDFVVRRGDGLFAYNFAVVVDDAFQGVDQVVRGDDLLSSAVRQAWLAQQLGLPIPEYAHVPLAVAPGGGRLAKRDGAIGLARLAADGWTIPRIVAWLGRSLGLEAADEATAADLVDQFNWSKIPRGEWVVAMGSGTVATERGPSDSQRARHRGPAEEHTYPANNTSTTHTE
ncbi:MAG: tRNA glutamyl-Q(34) synthetase GluQRS [Propionibacteriaceae bacterium]|jgi:glutamyl-tRNA synthetase|nr:tRNA glutamyl-Q(34) synthetase GluQRS [Propionibacteriaceae bacterium]